MLERSMVTVLDDIQLRLALLDADIIILGKKVKVPFQETIYGGDKTD
jgi:hypothetical protein